MHWVEQNGVRLPSRIGGHPALDFCNTWAGWGEPPLPAREWLKDYRTPLAWAAYAELLDPTGMERLSRSAARQVEAASAVLTRARRLRTLLHSAVLDPTDATALSQVSGYVRRAASRSVLRPYDGRPTWEFRRGVGLDQPVHAIALSAANLLTSAELTSVKACPGHDCGWLFVDPTGRRRWCSMSSCGNRAKVAAYARRQRSG